MSNDDADSWPDNDEAIDAYRDLFRAHGFGDYGIDFSDVKPEAIEAMAKALLALPAPGGKRGASCECIVAAAIVYDAVVWTLPPPARHHHIIRAHHHVTGNAGSGDGPGTSSQGFVTSAGRFVTREEALVIAREASQLLRAKSPHSGLFSEDVW